MSVPTRTERDQEAAQPQPLRRAEQVRPRVVRRAFSATGVGVAVGFFCLSLTPSLLPRAWFLQGAVSGITAAMGYGVGATIGAAARRLFPGHLPGATVGAWRVVLVAGPVFVALSLSMSTRWQRDLRRRLGMEPLDTYYLFRMVLISVLTFAVLLLIARTLRLTARALALLLRRFTPEPIAYCAGVLVVALVAVLAVDNLVVSNMFALADRKAALRNGGTDSGVVAPTSSLRSGGPFSLAEWDTLGRQGRDFVGRGPNRRQLAAFAGRPATEPIRVYVGLDSAPTVADRVRLVLKEMDRTGAFHRAVIAVVIPTGTGWVDGAVTNSLEYMYAGNTAMVSMQYSYLPSWISFLADTSKVIDASEQLITAVHDRWAAMPAAKRPKLLLFGESLGSLGMEKTFGTVDRMVAGADGVLLEGPTFANPLRNQLIGDRDPASRVWDPIHSGLPIEFAAQPAELRNPSWLAPKVVYLQNSSDPIVWWSPDLLFRSPAWLKKPRGPDVNPDMHWYPGITFWQTTVDAVFANDVPRGHGHVYKSGVVDGWAAIAPPSGWTVADTVRLRAMLDGSGP
ncbi:MAG TPA: alpha/beta-hydrolase family protein [Actinoplanes sp.]|jgi:uncharacterized membrane protein